MVGVGGIENPKKCEHPLLITMALSQLSVTPKRSVVVVSPIQYNGILSKPFYCEKLQRVKTYLYFYFIVYVNAQKVFKVMIPSTFLIILSTKISSSVKYIIPPESKECP